MLITSHPNILKLDQNNIKSQGGFTKDKLRFFRFYPFYNNHRSYIFKAERNDAKYNYELCEMCSFSLFSLLLYSLGIIFSHKEQSDENQRRLTFRGVRFKYPKQETRSSRKRLNEQKSQRCGSNPPSGSNEMTQPEVLSAIGWTRK